MSEPTDNKRSQRDWESFQEAEEKRKRQRNDFEQYFSTASAFEQRKTQVFNDLCTEYCLVMQAATTPVTEHIEWPEDYSYDDLVVAEKLLKNWREAQGFNGICEQAIVKLRPRKSPLLPEDKEWKELWDAGDEEQLERFAAKKKKAFKRVRAACYLSKKKDRRSIRLIELTKNVSFEAAKTYYLRDRKVLNYKILATKGEIVTKDKEPASDEDEEETPPTLEMVEEDEIEEEEPEKEAFPCIGCQSLTKYENQICGQCWVYLKQM